MPYTVDTRARRRHLIRDRWYNADALLQWATTAREAQINVLTERARLRAELNACKQSFDDRLPDDVALVDSLAGVWTANFQKINGLLSDRSQQAGASTDQQGNAIAPTRTMSSATQRAWMTALDEVIAWIIADQHVTGKTAFEAVTPWA